MDSFITTLTNDDSVLKFYDNLPYTAKVHLQIAYIKEYLSSKGFKRVGDTLLDRTYRDRIEYTMKLYDSSLPDEELEQYLSTIIIGEISVEFDTTCSSRESCITIRLNGDSDYPYSFYNLCSTNGYGNFIETMEKLLRCNNEQDNKELLAWLGIHVYVEPTGTYPHLYP